MITQALSRCWYLAAVETHGGTKYQLMLSFGLKVLGSLSADEQISKLLPKVESGFHNFPCQKLREEARVRFKVNEMLFHCLDNLKVY